MTLTIDQVQAFLYREARLLDNQQWDEWLACYSTNVDFWMPAWDDDGELTRDPQTEISLIYYPDRSGLEDRIFRIRTERSSASVPLPRTMHQISNVEIVSQTGDQMQVCFNWQTLSFRKQISTSYFGTSQYMLDVSGAQPVIQRKCVVLKNDYISHIIDIYHI